MPKIISKRCEVVNVILIVAVRFSFLRHTVVKIMPQGPCRPVLRCCVNYGASNQSINQSEKYL